ncbi:MAG: alpha/beta hydrolase [Alphaproteobacteria bacterium]|nr:alpha/beta hydrolase [Alphaproteobacteria bacterium]
MKKFFLVLLLLTGCATPNPLKEMRFMALSANGYTLFTTYQIKQMGEPLRIYIEGDGHAFDGRGRPTSDPTPKGTFLREVVAQDKSPNVVYLGRPCQYIKSTRCQVSDWTTGRFNADAVTSVQEVILTLMKKAKSQKVTLIGYSGGAQMAMFFADKYPEKVEEVITVAGVLHHEDWTKWHGDLPLDLSVSSPTLPNVPMRHYVGSKDRVVPVELFKNWVEDETLIEVKGASHNKGFEKVYDEIYR